MECKTRSGRIVGEAPNRKVRRPRPSTLSFFTIRRPHTDELTKVYRNLPCPRKPSQWHDMSELRHRRAASPGVWKFVFRYPCLKNFFHNCLITNDLKAAKASLSPLKRLLREKLA